VPLVRARQACHDRPEHNRLKGATEGREVADDSRSNPDDAIGIAVWRICVETDVSKRSERERFHKGSEDLCRDRKEPAESAKPRR
jgi:hypothetical protein